MSLRFPWKAGSILADWTTVRFSNRTLFNEVSQWDGAGLVSLRWLCEVNACVEGYLCPYIRLFHLRRWRWDVNKIYAKCSLTVIIVLVNPYGVWIRNLTLFSHWPCIMKFSFKNWLINTFSALYQLYRLHTISVYRIELNGPVTANACIPVCD